MFHPRTVLCSMLLVSSIAIAATSGCGSTRSSGATSTDFLGDLSDLIAVEESRGGDVYVKDAGVLREYSRFLLDPPLVVFGEGLEAGAIDPEGLAELTGKLRDEVAEQLRRGGYQVVERPGPGVLRLRAALTRVDASRPAVNLGGKVAGVASGVGGFLVPAVDLGGASIEVEMIDAASGERVAAFRDARKGKRFGGTVAAAKRWGHAEAAFAEWAKELRARLDELHGR